MKWLLSLLFAFTVWSSFSQATSTKNSDYYQIYVYHFKTAEQEAVLDNYLSKAYISAAKKFGIKQVGAFKPIANDTASDKLLVVVSTLSKLDQLVQLPAALLANADYQKEGATYINASHDNPPYNRMETIILKGFRLATKFQLPNLSNGVDKKIYELRSYESPTEKYYRNKVEMFNEGGEIPLFKRLNFNAIFYGDVLAGSRMPNLMYMTSFESMEAREQHWKEFFDSPEWKALISNKYYEKNVSKVNIVLMKATAYSDY
ncbi:MULTISPECIES: NIPSNAP family protein [unclassified Paraflavitalea]|uniref:NIPSNAP family protein n=1 Tax=unclassified Paraflavitalea TaxID=2798305 RepID=UPI003D34900C